MPTLDATGLVSALHWRYATKKFDATKKIPADIWNALEQALVLSPSSFGLQPWKFIVVTDQKVKDQLPAISWNQNQVREASHVVVIAAKKTTVSADVEKLIDRTIAVRKLPVGALDPYKGMIMGFVNNPALASYLPVWAVKQGYIALGTLMTAAAVLGIDACPMEGIEAPKYDALLGLDKSEYTTSVVCPLGYRAADDKYASLAKVRYDVSEVVQYI